MFFMGGMTLGYLQPPMPAKRVETVDDDRFSTSRLPSAQSPGESGLERALLWARRILC
jgi:hypothetical protein